MTKSYEHFNKARELRDRIIARQINTPVITAWAQVARHCAIAEHAFYQENPGVHGRRHQAFLTNLDKIGWAARAQVETLARRVA